MPALGICIPLSLQNLLNKKMKVFLKCSVLLVICLCGMEKKKRVLGFNLPWLSSIHPLHSPASHLSLAVFLELLVVDFFLTPFVFHTKVANSTLTHNLAPVNIWPVGTGGFNVRDCICTDLRDRMLISRGSAGTNLVLCRCSFTS